MHGHMWDHRVMGRALFPGAGFLEIGVAGALIALPIDLPGVEAAGATVVGRCRLPVCIRTHVESAYGFSA